MNEPSTGRTQGSAPTSAMEGWGGRPAAGAARSCDAGRGHAPRWVRSSPHRAARDWGKTDRRDDNENLNAHCLRKAFSIAGAGERSAIRLCQTVRNPGGLNQVVLLPSVSSIIRRRPARASTSRAEARVVRNGRWRRVNPTQCPSSRTHETSASRAAGQIDARAVAPGSPVSATLKDSPLLSS